MATEFMVLGPLEARSDGRVLDLGGPKQRALLLLLLLEEGRIVSRERLIDALWEDGPPETARKALQVYVSQLRKVLGRERLQSQPPGYLLQLGEDDQLDLSQIDDLLARGRFEDALALWRGPPLAELVDYPFANAEAARLEELRLRCLEERLDHDLATGMAAELIAELEALVRDEPRRERLRGQLMIALYRCGRQAEALAVYRDARRALVDELGIEPGRPLRELEQAILRQDPALEPPSAATTEQTPEETGGVFVGREPELAELLSGLDDAFAGRGRLFLLIGEPGVGKSRLAEEVGRYARARSAAVVVGRCWEAGGAPAYWPWVQALRSLIRQTNPSILREQLRSGGSELAQLLPELRGFFPDLSAPSQAGDSRFRLFEAVSSFLLNASHSRPIVLHLDDLHAADEPSLLLLQFLARELGGSRLLILAAFRDVDPTPTDPLTAVLTELAREPATSRLQLSGLDERDVARLIELASGSVPGDALVGAITEETDGNPLFVGEIVRLLAAEGDLSTFEVSRLAIPQSVRDVIGRRLRHLSEECNRVLLIASVLGREFALDALARMSGVDTDELLQTLDEAMAGRILSDVPGSAARLRFAHILIRDALYEGMTTARRVRLHRIAVDTLEALYGGEAGPHLAELAHHSIAGSEFDKGLVYAQRAGDQALALFAYEEAARLYNTALEALELADPSDESARCDLLLSLAEATARAGNMPAAKEAALAAAVIARRLELPRQLARAAASYGGRHVWERAGGDTRLVPLLEEALAGLDERDVELRARLSARLAGALRDEHSRGRRDALSRQAVELARQAGNPALLAYTLDARALAIFAPDSHEEVALIGDELAALGDQIDDKERAVQALICRFVIEVSTGEMASAKADLDAAHSIAAELRQPAQLGLVIAIRGMVSLAEGKFEEGERLSEEAFGLTKRSQFHLADSAHRLQLYALGDFRGNLEQAERWLGTLKADYPTRPALHCALVHFYACDGRTDEAEREFEQFAASGFEALPFDIEWLLGISFLAETCAVLGRQDDAAVLYRLLAPHASSIVVNIPEGIRGSTSRYLGLLASTLGHWDDAVKDFENAIAANEQAGLRPWLALTQHDYARMLTSRGRPGDQDYADTLLDRARATRQELGMANPEEPR